MIGKLHHIGIASRNINTDIPAFAALGYHPCEGAYSDTKAGIKVQFMMAEGQPTLELVQNLEKEGPVTPHLQAKRKIFHFAYESDDIVNDANKLMDEQSGLFLVPVTGSPESLMFESWCYIACRNMMIVELVQLRKD